MNRNFVVSAIGLFIFFSFPAWLAGQSCGCTDPKAINFSALAIKNDGSCSYPASLFQPKAVTSLSQEVIETSSLWFHENRLWTLNDSGGEAVLYAIDTLNGNILQRVSIGNASNVDWEEIASDEQYIYLGDFGNNGGDRKDLCVYKVPLKLLPDAGDGEIIAQQISFSYPDQTLYERNYTHNFDCEAFIAFGDSLYLFTKNRGDGHTKCYSLPKAPGVYAAKYRSKFNTAGLITGATYQAETNEIGLIGYQQGVFLPFVWLLFDFKGDDFFGGNKRRIDFPALLSVQTEGITYTYGKKMLISAEQTVANPAKLFRFESDRWTNHDAFQKPNKNRGRISTTVLSYEGDKVLITCEIAKLRKGTYRLDVVDKNGSIFYRESLSLEKNEVRQLTLSLDKSVSEMYFLTLLDAKHRYTETLSLK